jgi:hypothetical protein
MQREYAEKVTKYHSFIFNYILVRSRLIGLILDHKHDLDYANSHFAGQQAEVVEAPFIPFKEEIRNNILSIEDDHTLRRYLHYLIKLYLPYASDINKKMVNDALEKANKVLVEKDTIDHGNIKYGYNRFNYFYPSFDSLIYDCYSKAHEYGDYSNLLSNIITNEFGLEKRDWDKLFYLKGKELKAPGINDIEMFFNLEKIQPVHRERVEISEQLPKVKLQWRLQKNQLYAVLRQLKNEYEAIGNSYNELAEFIKQSVIGFEETSKETIEKELKKTTPLPKNKRIKLNPKEEQ